MKYLFYLVACGLFLAALLTGYVARMNYAAIPQRMLEAHRAEEPMKSQLIQKGQDAYSRAKAIQITSLGILVLASASWILSFRRKEIGIQSIPTFFLLMNLVIHLVPV